MHFTAEQRDAWTRETRDSPFNLWLRHQCCRRDGTLDLPRLHAVAQQYGIDPGRYLHLNPGQQRMNIGNRLRKIVPASDYNGSKAAVVQDVAREQATPLPASSHRVQSAGNTQPRGPLHNHSVLELLRLHAGVIEELRRREIVRTGNSPLGDYAEWLFARAFGWQLEGNSSAGHDAVDQAGVRYQIKARRVVPRRPGSRQLSIIRNLEAATFDVLAAVLFDEAYGVWRAALVPYDQVKARAMKVAHVNGWRFMLDEAVWSLPGVQDVTQVIALAQECR